MDLHRTSQSRDLVSEHLSSVIHLNEMRKAKKLADLMEDLELETDEETVNAKAANIDLEG